MKTQALSVLSVFFLACLVFSQIEDVQRPEWKGKIEVESSIKVVKNPRTPLYGILKLDLQEDISIGREDDKNYLFYLIWGVQVDDDGYIYVDDARNFRIQKFDRSGKYIRTIGRQGQGPGEFQQPTRIKINPQIGRLYVRDSPAQRITIFNLQGKYLETVPTKLIVSDYQPLGDGNIISCLKKFSEADLKSWYVLGKMNSKGETVTTTGEFLDNTVIEKRGGAISGRTSGYELELYLAPLDSERFVYGYSKDFKLTAIDKNLKTLYRFQKDEPRPVFTREEKTSFKNIPLPEFKPYFFMLLSDSKGRIYVQRNFTHNKNTVQDDIPKEVDVFSKDGYYLYKTILPPNTCVIRNGYIYSFLVDQEEGLESVKRYKIKNWDQIREQP